MVLRCSKLSEVLKIREKIINYVFREEDYDQGETSTKKNRENGREFRNHKPDEAVGTQNTVLDLDIVQREITDHLKVAQVSILSINYYFFRMFFMRKQSTV